MISVRWTDGRETLEDTAFYRSVRLLVKAPGHSPCGRPRGILDANDRSVYIKKGIENVWSPAEKIDFVFLDAVKKDYFAYFTALRPLLKP